MKLSDYVINAMHQIDRAVRTRGLGHTVRLALRVMATEGPAGVGRRLDALGPALRARRAAEPGAALILTTPHMLHFARRMQAILAEAGINAELSDNDRAAQGYDTVFAIAPQNFPAVPAERCIAFQVEQSTLPHRWTGNYLRQLGDCRAVLEYSQQNIPALQDHVPLRRIYHVPLTPLPPEQASKNRGHSVLFYGDASPERRARMLAEIQAALPELEIETNLFGPRMAERLSRTAIVLNIHSRKGGLLEVARISEAMAHGCIVVSETASDQDRHEALADQVAFAPEGNTAALIAALRKLLNDPDALRQKQEAAARPRPDRFRLGFLRALLGLDLITPTAFEQLASDYPSPIVDSGQMPHICLSLPETPIRSKAFLQQDRRGFRIWPGLKADPGWRGAALSYRHLMRALKAANIPEALIVEDDVILPADFDRRLDLIRTYMDKCDADLFSGLIVDLNPDVQVLGVERRGGLCLVQLDRAVMMICNLYRQRMIDYLADWDDTDDNAFSNTIDRYMERATHLRVVTTLPFTADYGASLQSTLREADNHVFDALRARSETLLARKVAAFERSLPVRKGIRTEQELVP
ncbi:MAG: glycosyltransferase [Paracoccus sp. (in: a-proteobacteria)]